MTDDSSGQREDVPIPSVQIPMPSRPIHRSHYIDDSLFVPSMIPTDPNRVRMRKSSLETPVRQITQTSYISSHYARGPTQSSVYRSVPTHHPINPSSSVRSTIHSATPFRSSLDTLSPFSSSMRSKIPFQPPTHNHVRPDTLSQEYEEEFFYDENQ